MTELVDKDIKIITMTVFRKFKKRQETACIKQRDGIKKKKSSFWQ